MYLQRIKDLGWNGKGVGGWGEGGKVGKGWEGGDEMRGDKVPGTRALSSGPGEKQ